jgi:excisionase family DNA binding protein
MNSQDLKLEEKLYFLKPVLNFQEACKYTGLSKSWMYKLTHRGSIPHYKPDGKMLYFKTTELENWMLRNKVLSDEEIRSKAAKHSLA